MCVLYYRTESVTLYERTYNLQLQCCSGYGPKPNCLRKLYLLLCTHNTCVTGWTGSDCLTGILNYLHIVLLYFYLISYL